MSVKAPRVEVGSLTLHESMAGEELALGQFHILTKATMLMQLCPLGKQLGIYPSKGAAEYLVITYTGHHFI